jgi:hypothetical protein
MAVVTGKSVYIEKTLGAVSADRVTEGSNHYVVTLKHPLSFSGDPERRKTKLIGRGEMYENHF